MEKNSNGLSIASITLGIISIIFFIFLYISIPTGVLAIVYGAKTLKGKAGIVTGIVGISLCVILHVTAIVLFATGVFHL